MSIPKRFVFTEAINARVGTVPDRVIAEELGCSLVLVQQFRAKHKIPAHKAHRSEALPAEKGSDVKVPSASTVPEAIRKALSSARPVAGGMVIPYALFADAISAAGV